MCCKTSENIILFHFILTHLEESKVDPNTLEEGKNPDEIMGGRGGERGCRGFLLEAAGCRNQDWLYRCGIVSTSSTLFNPITLNN